MQNLVEWCRSHGVDYQYAWKRINVEGLSLETVLNCWNNVVFQKWAKSYDLPVAQALSLRDMGLGADEILVFFKKPIEEWFTEAECKILLEHAHWFAISQCSRGRVIRAIERFKLKPKFHGKES